jgi:hypothetical protein
VKKKIRDINNQSQSVTGVSNLLQIGCKVL